ncbi:MAG TPA: CpcT/CpeT family chromophore lyase, partial [Phormidium sp.]
MTISPELIALAQYMAGEFDNREQALADPTWYVHLRLWQRPLPIPLFSEPSIALFAEQANILELDKPYRPRIVQLRQVKTAPGLIEAQY